MADRQTKRAIKFNNVVNLAPEGWRDDIAEESTAIAGTVALIRGLSLGQRRRVIAHLVMEFGSEILEHARDL